jgi:hypothetical protein
VQLRFGQETLTKSVWLKTKEQRQVLFTDLVCGNAGEYRIEAGKFQKTVNAEAPPPAKPVSAPYLTFTNVKSEMSQTGDVLSIVSPQVTFSLDQFNGRDTYASVYLKQALHQNQAVTVRVDRPNPMMRAYDIVGLMVKNDISKPAESPGYVTVQASSHWGIDRQWSYGYGMTWDADGDGRLDHHSFFDGYTIWPHWLKIERRGTKYASYYSLDGASWNKIGEADAPGGNEAEDVGVFAAEAGARFNDLKIVDLPR